MDVTALSITFGTIITICGLIIAFLGYKLNKAKANNDAQERVKENETRLVSIEKDVQYIRLSIDNYNKHFENVDREIQELKLALAKLKGGD